MVVKIPVYSVYQNKLISMYVPFAGKGQERSSVQFRSHFGNRIMREPTVWISETILRSCSASLFSLHG